MEYNQPCLIDLPKVSDPRGNLTFVEGGQHLPFVAERVYYLYDVPAGAERGGHSHRECYEFLVAISGSFDVTLDDGNTRTTYTLNRPWRGLLITPGIWRTLENFSTGSVCLVMASQHYDESDYVRSYKEFTALCKTKQQPDDK